MMRKKRSAEKTVRACLVIRALAMSQVSYRIIWKPTTWSTPEADHIIHRLRARLSVGIVL